MSWVFCLEVFWLTKYFVLLFDTNPSIMIDLLWILSESSEILHESSNGWYLWARKIMHSTVHIEEWVDLLFSDIRMLFSELLDILQYFGWPWPFSPVLRSLRVRFDSYKLSWWCSKTRLPRVECTFWYLKSIIGCWVSMGSPERKYLHTFLTRRCNHSGIVMVHWSNIEYTTNTTICAVYSHIFMQLRDWKKQRMLLWVTAVCMWTYAIYVLFSCFHLCVAILSGVF